MGIGASSPKVLVQQLQEALVHVVVAKETQA